MSDQRDHMVDPKKFLIKPISWLLAIIFTAGFVIWVEYYGLNSLLKKDEITAREKYPLKEKKLPLSKEEMQMARIAWKYFERNYQDSTGFVNSVDSYNSTSIWDLTSSLHALIGAYELGVIDSLAMNKRLMKALQSLEKIPLYKGVLPNKAYNTVTLDMVTYTNIYTQEGIGWSALDIGRFLTWCTRVVHNYPGYTRLINRVVKRWEMKHIIEKGQIKGMGIDLTGKRISKEQEGKLGYEEYCAKGYLHMGYDVFEAIKYTDSIDFVNIYDERIAYDNRGVKKDRGDNWVLSEPYILDGLEYGFDIKSRELAYRIFRVQKKRFLETGMVTAVSETHLDTFPHFAYNCIYLHNQPWVCKTKDGKDANRFKTISTSAAIGWYYLFNDPYSEILFNHVEKLYHPDLGWYGGRYELEDRVNKVLTANTNGLIIEALNYKLKGRLIESTK